jgi:methylmalonyl-CoA mutase cobalamin-binding domain/chain
LSKEEVLKRLADAVIAGDEDAAKASAKEAIDVGVPPFEAIMKGVCTGLTVVGQKFEALEFFYPDLVVSADTAMRAIDVIKPYMMAGGKKVDYTGTYVIGSVEGDMHDVGKDLVRAMLEAGGFSVIDLGVDVPAQKFVDAAIKNKADIVGSSATLAGGVKMKQKELEEALRKAGIRDKLKTMVGGIVTDDAWAKEINAVYGADCLEALKKAEELMKKLKEERKS